MQQQIKKVLIPFLGLTAVCTLVFLLYVLWQERLYASPDRALAQVQFLGNYQFSTTEQQKPLTPQTTLNASQNRQLILTGKFDREIAAGQSLLFRMENLRLKLYRNNELVYTYGQPESYPAFSKSPGNIWNACMSPGISPDDTLRLELESVYENNIRSAYDDFLNQIVIGDSGALFHHLFQEYGFTMFLGGIIFLLGCLLLLAILVLRFMKTRVTPKVFYFSLVSITVGLWFFFDFQIISLLIPWGVFGNILSMICLCLTVPLFGLYVLQFVEGESGVPLQIIVLLQLAFTLFYIVMQGLGIFDGFELLTPLVILILLGYICLLGTLLYETIYRKNRQTLFLLLSGSVLLLTCVDIKDYLLSYSPNYIMTKWSFCLFIIVHFLYMVHGIRLSLANLARAHKMEDELTQSRIAVAISQIQPHFLYNTLTAIKQLCAVNPKRAEQAVGEFSNFLRGNLDSITSRALIPFDKELNHIKNYLALEQLRFGNRLRVEYHLRATSFQLPSLTVQPLVENAVRYGVTKKVKGGTVTISTDEDASSVIITVSDDGVGFQPEEKPADERSHIGIENTRNRLRALCGGILLVKSAPGNGTVATIIIKKGDLLK